MNEMSAEKRNLLNVYQHCWDDDKVDVDLIAKLVLLIATTTPVSGTFSFPPPPPFNFTPCKQSLRGGRVHKITLFDNLGEIISSAG